MGESTKIPELQLNSAIVGSEHCFDAWREAVRAVYEVNPTAAGSTVESVSAWLLEGLVFSDVCFSAQSFCHDAKLALHSNFISLQLYKTGGCTGLIDGNSLEVHPNEVHVFDFSREFVTNAHASNVIGVVIPHKCVGYDPAIHPAHLVFSGDSPTGLFLTSVLLSLMDQLPTLQKSDVEDLKHGFCGLLRGIFTTRNNFSPAEAMFKRNRREEMLRYLNKNIANFDLDAAKLCEAFGMSRPSVYREFAHCGGVGNYITHLRLEKALHQLSSIPVGQRRIKEVAASVGFSDPAHFSRIFRQKFGLTPNEAATLGCAGTIDSFALAEGHVRVGFSQLSSWLRSI